MIAGVDAGMERFHIILSRNTSCTDDDHVGGSDT